MPITQATIKIDLIKKLQKRYLDWTTNKVLMLKSGTGPKVGEVLIVMYL